MATKELDQQFELLRAQIEIAVVTPGVAVVSSACPRDGKSATALGLAKSFSAAGHQTLILEAGGRNEPSSRVLTLDKIAESGISGLPDARPRSLDLISISVESERRSASRAAITKAFDVLRAKYDYIVVDAAQLLDSSLALMLARYADTIVLSVRQGRSVKAADRELARLVEREELPVLGVVVVSANAIRSAATEASRKGVTDFSSRFATVDSVVPARRLVV